MRLFVTCTVLCLISVLVTNWLKGSSTDFSWSEGIISVSLVASATAALLQVVKLLGRR